MHFVDRDRSIERIAPAALCHPGPVLPLVAEVPHHAASTRRHLMVESVGVRLVKAVAAVAGDDVILVPPAGAEPGHKGAPDAALARVRERRAPLVPAVEVP